MKKIALIMVMLTLLALTIAACSGPTDGGGTPTGGEQQPGIGDDTETIEEVVEIVTDNLPDDLDFGGHVFHIFTRENSAFYQYIVEELSGELLEDAIYHRARNVEERLNINFLETTNSDANAPRRFMLAGDDTYDMFNARCSHALNFWIEGLTVEIDDLPFIDLSKPYWLTKANESVSLNNRQHVAIGAANLTVYEFTYVLLFNKQMIIDLALPCPYELVRSGQWTMERMDQMMRAATMDLDGSGTMTINDRFGYVARHNDVLPNFWIAAGVRSISKDSDDIPFFSANEERFISVFNRTFEMLWDTNAWFRNTSPDANVPSTSIQIFTEDRALFMDCQVSFLPRLRGMETDFGIIPYPKYDENQEQHFARVSFYDAFVVSRSNPDLARTSAVIEALNSESYRIVIPVYYELCLQTQFARDDESEEMLDLIFNNLVIDLGDSIWVDSIRDSVFAPMFATNNRNIVSRLDAMERAIQRDIDRILDMD